jgi:hypothetical protein
MNDDNNNNNNNNQQQELLIFASSGAFLDLDKVLSPFSCFLICSCGCSDVCKRKKKIFSVTKSKMGSPIWRKSSVKHGRCLKQLTKCKLFVFVSWFLFFFTFVY